MRVTLTFVLLLSGCVDVVQHGSSIQIALEAPCNTADAVTADAWKVRAFAGREQLWERELASFPSVVALAPGTDLHLEFDALEAGAVVGRGASLHFNVVEGVPPGPEGLVISVKPLGRFVQRCAGLTHARTGHTATLLADGSVLIVGGLDDSGAALSSMEHLGVVDSTEVGPLGVGVQGNVISLPRAFHSAVRLENGQVVIAGGETVATGDPSVVGTILVIDPSVDFGQGALSNAGNTRWTGRTRHAAFLHGETVLLAGGVVRATTGLTAADELQRLDTTSFTFGAATTLTSPTTESGLALVGDDVIYAGGVANGVTTDLVRFVPARGGNARDVRLATARSLPSVFSVGGNVLVSGGIDSSSRFLDRSEWISETGSTPGPLTHARAKACVVPLRDGRVFLFGGLSANGPTNLAELISPDGMVVSISDPAISGRVDHTCTLLEDGSILIAAGRTNAGPASDLWQFAP